MHSKKELRDAFDNLKLHKENQDEILKKDINNPENQKDNLAIDVGDVETVLNESAVDKHNNHYDEEKNQNLELNIPENMSLSSLEDSTVEDTNEYNSHNTVEEYEMQYMENTRKGLRENINGGAGEEDAEDGGCGGHDGHDGHDACDFINRGKLKKLSLHAVENQLDKYYNDDNHSFSSALDILASYLKGQKTIYIEAKEFLEWRLNCLMLPALFLSSAASIGAETLGCDSRQRLILCMMNVSVSLLLAIINFCKLDAAAQSHKTSAVQYDTLQSSVEFLSGSILLGLKKGYESNKSEILKNVEEKLYSVEEKIVEVKQTNLFVVPRAVRMLFPVISNTNIFSIIKKIDDNKKKVTTSLKNVKNEIRFINMLQNENYNKGREMSRDYKYRLMLLFDEKRRLLKEILLLKSAYSLIDQMFNQEMKNAEKIKQSYIRYFFFAPRFVSYKEYERSKRSADVFLDPEKINYFLEKLMDPFKEKCETKKDLHHLETLWFNIDDQDWLESKNNEDGAVRFGCGDANITRNNTTDLDVV